MKSNILISLVLTTTLFIGCGGNGTSVSKNEPLLSVNSSGDILVVKDMKKSVKLKIDKENITYKIINKPTGISIEIQSYSGILTFWAEGEVGEIYDITVQAFDIKDWKSKPLTLSFKIVSKNIIPTIEVLKTGINGDKGKERNFTKNSKGYVVDPFGNQWENKLKGKALESQSYIYSKSRCDILRLINKNSNWRVPTSDELLNLVDYSKVSGKSMLDNIFDKANLITWFDSSYDNRYTVFSQSSGTLNEVKFLNKFPVRCINSTMKSNEHIISTKVGLIGNTFDFTTGLVWSAMTKDSSKKIIDNINDSASEYCATYDGASGWRLPNINEVRSIIDNNEIPPSISRGNNVIFSSTPLNSQNTDNKKAYYYLAIEKGIPIISASSSTNTPYPITCVKKIEN